MGKLGVQGTGSQRLELVGGEPPASPGLVEGGLGWDCRAGPHCFSWRQGL